MSVEVTQADVDTAKLLLVIDKAQGRPSDEWVIRVAHAGDSCEEADPGANAS